MLTSYEILVNICWFSYLQTAGAFNWLFASPRCTNLSIHRKKRSSHLSPWAWWWFHDEAVYSQYYITSSWYSSSLMSQRMKHREPLIEQLQCTSDRYQGVPLGPFLFGIKYLCQLVPGLLFLLVKVETKFNIADLVILLKITNELRENGSTSPYDAIVMKSLKAAWVVASFIWLRAIGFRRWITYWLIVIRKILQAKIGKWITGVVVKLDRRTVLNQAHRSDKPNPLHFGYFMEHFVLHLAVINIARSSREMNWINGQVRVVSMAVNNKPAQIRIRPPMKVKDSPVLQNFEGRLYLANVPWHLILAHNDPMMTSWKDSVTKNLILVLLYIMPSMWGDRKGNSKNSFDQ